MKNTLFIITILLSLFLSSCIDEDVDLAVYRVSCSSDNFQVTYDSYNGTETKTVSKKNWGTTFSVNPGDNVSITALALDSNATITAEIFYDGETLATSSKSGNSAEVSVRATIPQ